MGANAGVCFWGLFACLFEGSLSLEVNFPFSRCMEKRSNKQILKNCCTTLIKHSVLKLSAQGDPYLVN